MRYEYTDGENSNFVGLSGFLDKYLNQIIGGEENKIQYIPYNKINDIHDVIFVY